MKVYDEFGNYIGEFIEDSKESVEDSFETSLSSGCLAVLVVFAIKFPWLIIVIIGWLLLQLVWATIKLFFRIIWWLVRLPFTLFFQKEFPEW